MYTAHNIAEYPESEETQTKRQDFSNGEELSMQWHITTT